MNVRRSGGVETGLIFNIHQFRKFDFKQNRGLNI